MNESARNDICIFASMDINDPDIIEYLVIGIKCDFSHNNIITVGCKPSS